jgi:hypothetical protein
MYYNNNLAPAFGKYTTVFQAEIYAMRACAVENLEREFKNGNIYILSEIQAAIKTLYNYHINSILVWGCHQSLVNLAKYNRVRLT